MAQNVVVRFFQRREETLVYLGKGEKESNSRYLCAGIVILQNIIVITTHL